MSNPVFMQGGTTTDDLREVLRVTEARGAELNFVVTNQHKTKRLMYVVEEARGPNDGVASPDFSQVATVAALSILDPKAAKQHTVPVARGSNYRVRVKSAVDGQQANFRAYCEKDASQQTPLGAGAFDKFFSVNTGPAYEALGRGVAVLGQNLQLVTHVVVYDARNPLADPLGPRTIAEVAPFADENILNDGLGAYLDAADGTRLMVVWPVGYTAPIGQIALVDSGSTPDSPREVIKPSSGIDKPTPVIASVTAPAPLSIRVEGENLGGAAYLLTSRGGSPRNYDKGGWFGRFGAALPSETAIEIRGDWGADDLDPVDEAGIRDAAGVETVETGLSIDMDDPGTSSAPTIESVARSGNTITVTGTNLDADAVQRLTAGFSNGSISAYKPGGPLEPYNAGNGVTVQQWDATTIEFDSPYMPSGALLGVSVQNLSGSGLAEYTLGVTVTYTSATDTLHVAVSGWDFLTLDKVDFGLYSPQYGNMVNGIAGNALAFFQNETSDGGDFANAPAILGPFELRNMVFKNASGNILGSWAGSIQLD